MKERAFILFQLALLFAVQSCNSFISVSKTYDPEINLEKRPYRIGLINNFNYMSEAYVKEKNENVYHACIMNLADGISSALLQDKSMTFVFNDTLKKDLRLGQLTVLMPPDTIRSLCSRYGDDLLMTVDSTKIDFNWETIKDEDHLKTKNFYLITSFYLSLYWSDGSLINRSKIERSTLYSSRPTLSGLITIKPSIAKTINEVKPLAFNSGKEYVSKFYPVTLMESRMIYSGKMFKESNLFISLKNWGKATELLEPLTRSSDSNTAMKARHNLEVVKEAASNYQY